MRMSIKRNNPPTHSLDFESGSSQYLSISSANWGAYNRSKYAYSIWVKKETGSGADMTIFQKGDNGTKREFDISFQGAGELDIRSYVSNAINGRLLTNTTYTSTSAWYHIYYQFDSSASSADRMRLWVDGGEVTSFATDTNPTSATSTDTGIVNIGASGSPSQFFDGLIYQPAFFSGTLPTIGQVYNAGDPLDVSGLPGLWSLLNTNATDASEDDYVLASNWTNVNTVIKSTTIP